MTAGRFLLLAFTLWGLVMIVPGLFRFAEPLSSLGLFASGNGLITDVGDPFPEETASPAWRAGIRVGDRIDLKAMGCRLAELSKCSDTIAVLGGVDWLLPGSTVTLDLVATKDKPARQVTVVAEQPPTNFLVRTINILCQVAGILVIVAAAWLVWSRPSAMSWGFFLYVNWFNPGQVHTFYALLQPWPALFLVQDAAMVIAQAAGYAGFLLFVLRVPNNTMAAKWLERALPLVALVFALALFGSYGSLFGYRAETVTRASIFMGFIVAVAALAILMIRRRTLTPEDYQRVRWVIWGCLIGLPAFLLADLASTTAALKTQWGDFTPSDDIIGLLYLVNGVLCLFVFEALRRPRVVNVMIPLRRVTILGLTLSVPVLLLHHGAERIQEQLSLPDWAWVAVGAATVYLISRLHEGAVHLADRYFNRAVDEAELKLGQAMRQAKDVAELDKLLADETFSALKLASAAAFRRAGSVFARDGNGKGWDSSTATRLKSDASVLAPISEGKPFTIADQDNDGIDLPTGLARPIYAVPAVNPVRCFAVSLYGPHASGTDLDTSERAMLARLGAKAATMYAELENGDLHEEIARLKREVHTARQAAKDRPD